MVDFVLSLELYYTNGCEKEQWWETSEPCFVSQQSTVVRTAGQVGCERGEQGCGWMAEQRRGRGILCLAQFSFHWSSLKLSGVKLKKTSIQILCWQPLLNTSTADNGVSLFNVWRSNKNGFVFILQPCWEAQCCNLRLCDLMMSITNQITNYHFFPFQISKIFCLNMGKNGFEASLMWHLPYVRFEILTQG